MSQQLNTILKNTFLRADFLHRMDLLKGYLEGKYYFQRETYSLEGFLKAQNVSPLTRESFLSWGDSFYDLFNKENFHPIIKEMLNCCDVLPILTIYVPVDLPETEIPRIGKWVRTNVSPETLIDLRVNRSLVGGCALVWKGQYKELSLHQRLEKNRDALVSTVSNYVPSK